ncbi:MAG: AraC family transcriptional regulator [Vicinamibacterales bacterium]
MAGRSTQWTRYWNPPSCPGVSCLDAAFTSQHFAPHSHEALVIAVTEAGGSSYKSRGRSAEATPSVLLVFNPAEPHEGHMRDSRYWHYRALYLARPALEALVPALGMTRVPGFTSNAVANARLIRAFAGAHRELDHGDPSLGRERLIEACGHLFSSYAAADASPATDLRRERTHVDTALAMIRARFRERIMVDELATAAGLSAFQLIRQFNRLTGMPPHAHVLRARLHEAIRQMRYGAGLGEAAAASGFYDQSALTRHFRRAYAITPGQYMRARRVGA